MQDMKNKYGYALEKKENIVEYDILRVIVTLLVIIGHSTYYVISTKYGGCDYTEYTLPKVSAFYRLTEYAGIMIYMFHMPLYFALSGALFNLKERLTGYRSYKHLIGDKTRKLLIPFIVVTLIYSVPLKYVSGYYSSSTSVLKDIFWGQILVQGNTHLWFLPALFMIFILAYSINKYVHLNRGFILGVLYSFTYASGIVHISVIGQVLSYAFWFYLGYYFEGKRGQINDRINRHPYEVLAYIVLFLFVAVMKKLIPDDQSVYVFYVAAKLLGSICAALGCYIVYVLSYMMTKTKLSENKYFKVIRNNTLGLYLYSDTWNYIILAVATIIFGNAVFTTNIGAMGIYFGRIMITFMIALVVSMILKKFKVKYIC